MAVMDVVSTSLFNISNLILSYEDYDAHSRSCIRPGSAPFIPPSAAPSTSNFSSGQSCRHCLLIFASSTELAVHLRTSRACGEATRASSAQKMNPPNIICCPQCRKTFGTNYELADHVKKWHSQQT